MEKELTGYGSSGSLINPIYSDEQPLPRKPLFDCFYFLRHLSNLAINIAQIIHLFKSFPWQIFNYRWVVFIRQHGLVYQEYVFPIYGSARTLLAKFNSHLAAFRIWYAELKKRPRGITFLPSMADGKRRGNGGSREISTGTPQSEGEGCGMKKGTVLYAVPEAR